MKALLFSLLFCLNTGSSDAQEMPDIGVGSIDLKGLVSIMNARLDTTTVGLENTGDSDGFNESDRFFWDQASRRFEELFSQETLGEVPPSLMVKLIKGLVGMKVKFTGSMSASEASAHVKESSARVLTRILSTFQQVLAEAEMFPYKPSHHFARSLGWQIKTRRILDILGDPDLKISGSYGELKTPIINEIYNTIGGMIVAMGQKPSGFYGYDNILARAIGVFGSMMTKAEKDEINPSADEANEDVGGLMILVDLLHPRTQIGIELKQAAFRELDKFQWVSRTVQLALLDIVDDSAVDDWTGLPVPSWRDGEAAARGVTLAGDLLIKFAARDPGARILEFQTIETSTTLHEIGIRIGVYKFILENAPWLSSINEESKREDLLDRMQRLQLLHEQIEGAIALAWDKLPITPGRPTRWGGCTVILYDLPPEETPGFFEPYRPLPPHR